MTEQEADKWAIENLSQFLVEERISDVIRRPAPVFGGRRAIDLIMEGGTSAIFVMAIYENVLGYQPEHRREHEPNNQC